MESLPPDPATLVACAQCDALHHYVDPGARATTCCVRCGSVMFAPRPGSIALVLSLSISALVLMGIAIFYPFLKLSASGLSSQASLLDAVESYALSDMAPLSIALAVMILILPVARLILLIYVTLPLSLGRRPWPGAFWAFRVNAIIRPWSMAEIFMVGVAVAMVKVSDLATLEFGLAFWAFAAVVVLVAAKDALTCERTIWHTMSKS